jgi:hypothetical protein
MRALLAAFLSLSATLLGAQQVRVTVDIDEGDQNERRDRPRRIPVTAEHLATAFRDSLSRQILTGARVRRMSHDSSLRAYDATTYQRISAGLAFKAIGRERLVFRHENATRVRWQQGVGALVDVKGARTVVPVAQSEEARKEIDEEVNREMGSNVSGVPYFPGQEALWVGAGLAEAQVDERELVHPIAEGAEAYYRYISGDSMTYRLPGGPVVRLIELRIQPRVPKWNLVVGSFWFDRATYQLVRAAYRLSVPIDIWEIVKEEEPDADEEIPFWVKPMITPMRGNVSTITVEYGLYEGRFWLPRLQAAEGEGQVSFMRVPVRMEERFEYTSVNGTDPIPVIPISPAAARRDTLYSLDSLAELGDSSAASLARSMRSADSVARQARRDTLRALDQRANDGDEEARAQAREMRRRPLRGSQCDTSTTITTRDRRYDGALRVAVRLPCDESLLINSAALPASIYEPTEEMFGDRDIAELRGMLDFGLQPEWAPQRPSIRYGLGDGLLRYNRVEGLSPGIAARTLLGRGYTADAEVRLGFADLEPAAEVGLSRSDGRRTLRLGAYRRLAVSNDWGSPLSFGASLSALLFARDEGFYYRSLGAELAALGTGNPHFSWRAFVERHDSAVVETDASLANAINGVSFRPNIAAAEGEVIGASVRIVHSYGENPRAFRLLTELRGESAFGDFTYTRGLADFTLSRHIVGRVDGSLTLSAGSATLGTPVQRWFYLGGSQTIRGQHAGAMAGETFWMSRAEVGSGNTMFRSVLFGDIGWAGASDAWRHPGRPASGVGLGTSIMDGLIRFDVARGIFPRSGMKVDLYLEGRF